jgi:hypothetical protein
MIGSHVILYYLWIALTYQMALLLPVTAVTGFVSLQNR